MTGYGDGVLSDARIAAMSPTERRDLIQRLQRPLDEVHPPPIARRMRRNRLTLMVGGAIGLIPWIVYLGFTLPANYVAQNWPATWVGSSEHGAGILGFAGTAHKDGAGQPAGLITLADDAFGGGPRIPMMPGTWGADSAPPPDPSQGG